MKKVLFSVAMIATFVGVMMTSCKKEKETVLSEKAQTEVNDPQNDAVVSRILDFKNKVDERKLHPGTRSGETMTLEDAMNNVVDLFNATYTEPTAYYGATERHQFSINVPLTVDGEVLVDDVVAAYEQAVTEAREAYHSSVLVNKGYRRLMVTYDLQRDGEVSLDFDGQYGSKTDHPQPPTPHIDGPFNEGDDWNYANGMGSCDGLRDGGADIELQTAIMAEVHDSWPVQPADSCILLFTNFVPYSFHGPQYTGVFYSTDTNQTCIEWQYMNDYFAGEKRNIYQVVPQELNINLSGNYVQNFRYYVFDVEINGTSGTNIIKPEYIRHDTQVIYARYYYINSSDIEPQQL
jgi:hypothetical protein